MAKRLTLFALRLMFLNFVSIIIALILSLWNNAIYQWVTTVMITFLLWLFVWLDAVNIGQKDVQKDKITKRKMTEENYLPTGEEGKMYKKWLGFTAGALAQAPAFILLVIVCFADRESVLYIVLMPILRAWYFSYSQVMLSFEGALPYLLFLFPLLFAAVAGIAYMNGPMQQLRLETIIARNKAKKAKRVQDEIKNKKKKGPQQKKGSYRR